jgi:hypothetical protein
MYLCSRFRTFHNLRVLGGYPLAGSGTGTYIGVETPQVGVGLSSRTHTQPWAEV